jgi:hypothetical protein
MPLRLIKAKIYFNGRVIGKMKWDGTNTRVHFELKYKAPPDDAIVPISYLARGLAVVFDKKPSGPQVAVSTAERDVKWQKKAIRMLTEKTVKGDGHKWVFHKNDADHWPSHFHGHDYENHLKLDVVSGEIFDAGTRQSCGKLKRTSLKMVRDELKKSKDFKSRVDALMATEKERTVP